MELQGNIIWLIMSISCQLAWSSAAAAAVLKSLFGDSEFRAQNKSVKLFDRSPVGPVKFCS
jgi:hypothetical protein